MGILILELRLPGCRSLKEKRHLLRGLIERARREFQVGIAEVGDQGLWGNATVCATCPCEAADHALRVLDSVEKHFGANPGIDVADAQREIWRP